MAITTDSYYDIIKDGVTLDRIGLSKTLNNYTIEEIADYAYVGSYSQCGKQIMPQSESGWTYVGYSQSHGSCPFAAAFHSGGYDRLDIEDGLIEDYNLTENGIYRKVVLLHDTTGTYPFNLTTSSLANMKIITEFDAPKYTMDFGSTSDMLTSESGSHYWRPYEQTSKYNTHLGYGNNEQINTCGFHAYIVIAYNSTYYIIMANIINKIFSGQLFQATNINNSNISVCANQIADYQNSNPAGIAETVTQWFSNYDFTGDNPTPIVQYLFSDAEYWNDYGGYCSVILFHDKGFRQVFNFTEEYNLLLFIAGCYGIHFIVDGTVYKPIISDNFVVGYSDDLNVVSDLDGYSGSTKHDLPVTPPGPTPPPTPGDDDDNTDPIPTVGAPYSSGLARYYVTTAGSVILSHISQAMGEWNLKDSGKDLYKNIISCKLIKSPAPIPVSGSEPFTVYGVTPQYEGSDITLPVVSDNPTASFGSYNIPRKFNDFRDYAPYTKVEIYLPYCGWTVLPSHVVGRSVSVTYYTDIIAATCKAVVYCGSNVVAESAGVIGLDIPMVTENAGAKAEAVTMGLLAYGKAGLQTALGVGAAVATKGKAGVKQAVSGLGDVVSAYSQTAMAFNQNYTEINGKNGDGCCIAGISAIVIKITRPKYGSNTTPPYVPSEYPHSTGYVSMKSAKVSSFTGLLVADNVDTSGISGATDREKQLIKLYLESGIYVNHPN